MIREFAPPAYLFSEHSLPDWLRRRLATAMTHIEALSDEVLLGMSEDDLKSQIERNYIVEHPVLHRAGIAALPVETVWIQIEETFAREGGRRRTQLRQFAVPYTGDHEIFQYQGSHFGLLPPTGIISRAEREIIIALYEWATDAPSSSQIEAAVHAELDKFDRLLDLAKIDVDQFNRDLTTRSAEELSRRLREIARERELEAQLPFRVRRRVDADSMMPVPVRPRHVEIAVSKSSASTQAPEPGLDDRIYEQIMTTIDAMRNALERNPSTAAALPEVSLRDIILVSLNAQFEGRAAGEVFNGSGKTDILIRENDRNVFIAECKIWDGPAKFTQALDQLAGYLVWRDTKAAILLFIRGGNVSAICAKATAAIQEHPNYKRAKKLGEPGGRSDFTFRAVEDPSREIHLAFVPFAMRAS